MNDIAGDGPTSAVEVVPTASASRADVAAEVEALFRAHYARLVRALTVVSGSREAAADAVQDAFVKAHLHWRKIRRYDDPVGWIRRVAVNRLRDDHRRHGRRERALERLAAQHRTAGEESAADWSAGSATAEETAALLAGLPRQQRIAVALFYVDGMPVAEVAAAMGITEGAVKFHLHQGRARLRSVFAPEPPGDPT